MPNLSLRCHTLDDILSDTFLPSCNWEFLEWFEDCSHTAHWWWFHLGDIDGQCAAIGESRTSLLWGTVIAVLAAAADDHDDKILATCVTATVVDTCSPQCSRTRAYESEFSLRPASATTTGRVFLCLFCQTAKCIAIAVTNANIALILIRALLSDQCPVGLAVSQSCKYCFPCPNCLSRTNTDLPMAHWYSRRKWKIIKNHIKRSE